MDDRGEQTGCGRAVQGSSRLVVVSCCQSSPSVCPRGPQSVTQPDTNPTAFRGRRWIHAFLLSERAPPRGLKAETHPNCVRETGQSATRVCVRASATLHTTPDSSGGEREREREEVLVCKERAGVEVVMSGAGRPVPVPTSCPRAHCPLAVDTLYYKVWRTE